MKEGSTFRAADDSNPEASWFRGFLYDGLDRGEKVHEDHEGHEFIFVISVSSLEGQRSRYTELDLYPDDGYLL